MPAPATLTGQDVGEAEGALTALLNQVLSNTDITRTQYITLRVLALRGPAPSPAELHDYLAGQPQLGLDRSQIAELLLGLEAKGLVAGTPPTDPGPPSSPPRAPPCTPGWPRPSVPSPDACMPTLTQTTLPPPIGCWSRSPNALGAFVTNPEENVSVPPRLNLARPADRTSGGEERCSCWLPAGRDISARTRSRRWREPGTGSGSWPGLRRRSRPRSVRSASTGSRPPSAT